MALQRTQSLTTTKIAKGSAAGHIGMKGELTVSDSLKDDNTVDLRLHDGITEGGVLLDSYEVKEGWAKAQADANQNSGPPPLQATGGTESTYTDDSGQAWKVHTFTSDGTFSVTSEGEIEYLIVGESNQTNMFKICLGPKPSKQKELYL